MKTIPIDWELRKQELKKDVAEAIKWFDSKKEGGRK